MRRTSAYILQVQPCSFATHSGPPFLLIYELQHFLFLLIAQISLCMPDYEASVHTESPFGLILCRQIRT